MTCLNYNIVYLTAHNFDMDHKMDELLNSPLLFGSTELLCALGCSKHTFMSVSCAESNAAA